MENVQYLKTMCPACDGSIEFPADALGQPVECPHCHKAIVLGSVAARAQPPKIPSVLRQQPAALNQMNVNQKLLTGAALLAFLVSVCNASWEVISFGYDGNISNRILMISPIWQEPHSPYSGAASVECHLLWSPLLSVWIAIGVLYTGLFFLLKNTPSILEWIRKKYRGL